MHGEDGFIKAKSKRELEKVPEIPFDKHFFNFEDPEVFDAMTNSPPKKKSELWKKTYGFDWTRRIDGFQGTGNFIPCWKHCLRAEYSPFAKSCKKSGGLFKCCVYGYISPFFFPHVLI